MMKNKKYFLHQRERVTYVITDCKRYKGEQPNFDGTNMALAGVLKTKQSLRDWITKMEAGENQRAKSAILFEQELKNMHYHLRRNKNETKTTESETGRIKES